MNTPTRQASAPEQTVRPGTLGIPALDRLPTIPFPAELALDYLHGAYVLSESDESAIVEAAAIRYGKLPAVEQDGSYEWLIDCEFDKLDAERRDDYEDAYAERCGGW